MILKVSLILTKLVFLSGIGFIFISKSWTRGHIYGSDVPLTILEKPLKLAPVKHCKNCQLLLCHSSMFYQLRQELFALDCAIKDPQWVTLSIFTLPNPTQPNPTPQCHTNCSKSLQHHQCNSDIHTTHKETQQLGVYPPP